jgi:hypothetical protein
MIQHSQSTAVDRFCIIPIDARRSVCMGVSSDKFSPEQSSVLGLQYILPILISEIVVAFILLVFNLFDS